ncbi:MAG: isoaspartyl peptidase/L-asparaginase [Verrucomicrobiales bacterium]
MFARHNFLPIAIAIAGLAIAPAFAEETTEAKPRYAVAVHGGAGGSPGPPESAEYKAKEAGMRKALALGRDRLAEGKSSIEVVEAVIRFLEDHPSFNAGKGAVLNAAGEAECDASIMDGRDLSCGGCAITRRTKNPITLARKVMEDGRHVLLSGEGADAFAAAHKLALVEPGYFVTPAQRDRLRRTQESAVERRQSRRAAGRSVALLWTSTATSRRGPRPAGGTTNSPGASATPRSSARAPTPTTGPARFQAPESARSSSAAPLLSTSPRRWRIAVRRSTRR